MKNFVKIIALVTAVVLTAFSLCSCQELDNAKVGQAFYTDSAKSELVLHDNVFKRISLGNLELICSWNYDAYNRYVTEKNVPVLLSSWYGDWYSVNKDETFISVIGKYYVRADKYDEIRSIINGSALDCYYISRYSFRDYDDYYLDYMMPKESKSNVLLDDETTAAFNRALGISSNEKVKYDTLSEGDYSLQMLQLYPCDKDMLLTDNDTTYYLIRDGEKYYAWDGNSYDEYSICPVAKEDIELMKALFEECSDAIVNENIRQRFENNLEYDDFDYEGYYGVR